MIATREANDGHEGIDSRKFSLRDALVMTAGVCVSLAVYRWVMPGVAEGVVGEPDLKMRVLVGSIALPFGVGMAGTTAVWERWRNAQATESESLIIYNGVASLLACSIAAVGGGISLWSLLPMLYAGLWSTMRFLEYVVGLASMLVREVRVARWTEWLGAGIGAQFFVVFIFSGAWLP